MLNDVHALGRNPITEIGAHRLHCRATSALVQARHVLQRLVVLVARVGKHGAKRHAALQREQVGRGRVLPAADTHQMLRTHYCPAWLRRMIELRVTRATRQPRTTSHVAVSAVDHRLP